MKNCCQFVFYKNIARFLLLFLLEFLEKKEKNKLRHHHVISHKPKLSINQRMRNRSVIVKKESRVFHYTYTVLQFFFYFNEESSSCSNGQLFRSNAL